ncbi:gas vesicle structural protein GvpA [Frankia sp. CNm7]|uniref:Gas vesicle protein A n=1 Tax=Frankia nepalensis TaxID=1836974 RepID=A0A937RIG6_9ACTN|nr:gas vesicle structural protein GvpA [Frankia nepalensis]MBL7496598.1 gas vesicle structural protein GvpA [Frankia nepalensis]MBL7513341.1 gas vesicle structural protein GvpA [Frankia nepalensis]MBL7521600.1 gas vesicle structural protein GvpA [Frankia nepalensis]MBL7626606.1 gas vesicle structural protein GvpA [Frankia nepalensis]
MTLATQSINRAPRPSSLADVLEVVLDKGIVIDAYVRVALVGIEILTIDARIVIASVDTYLRFAEAVNRLDLSSREREQVTGVPGLVQSVSEGGSRHKAKGALEGVKDTAQDFVSSLRGDDDRDEAEIERGSRHEYSHSDAREYSHNGARDLPPGRAAPTGRGGGRGGG